MGKKSDLLPTVRAQISILHQAGHSQMQIASRLHISQSVVSKALIRIRDMGSFLSRPKCGRPRVTTRRDDAAIRRAAIAHPLSSASDIAAGLPVESPVSLRTIRRRLSNEMGLKSYRPATKPRLSEKNIRDRITFCRKYAHWTSEQWNHVLFTDEASIKQFQIHHGRVRRPPNQRYNQRFTVPCVKHSQSLMVWGSICAAGPQGLWIQPQNTTINAHGYLTILSDSLLASMQHGNCQFLVQDGAPCHTAKIVKRWLQDNGVNLIGPWPGSSPDLNPIENCWAMVKDAISKKKPSSIADLRVKIQEIWNSSITTDFCKKLADSMPRRIQKVLKSRGHYSSY